MLLGLPMGHDEVQFNIHRIYGPLQMSHMLANWEQIHATDPFHAEIVLAEDRSRVLWPNAFESKHKSDASQTSEYQPGIVAQKKENKKSDLS